MERLTRRDWAFLAICIALFAISLGVATTWFDRAFPEASIEFRYDREGSRAIAQRILDGERVGTRGMRHTAIFDGDETAKIFLERSLGLEKASAVMQRDVRLWWWHHRWFQPSVEEEYALQIAPTGELVAYSHHIPEDRAAPAIDAAAARAMAEAFLKRVSANVADLQLVAQSERQLKNRTQRIFTWDSKSIRPAGAPYRTTVVVDGNVIGDYAQRIRVPDAWQRSYRDLRSKNLLAGNVDLVFLAITMIAALVVFIIRLRHGDIPIRFLLAIGGASFVLTAGVALNEWPQVMASYETTTSYAAFLAQFVLLGIMLKGVAAAMLLIVLCGAGEVLYRERAPQHLAIPRLWTVRALGSKRVFRSFVLGYTLVAFFFAYQVVFYIVASKFGAWSPAEVPYDNILNSALPWVAVLFAGFFPALSEEFLSRAFSIPFFHRVLRSRAAAIVAAAFIWGFGHSTYLNQPFYIRGLEVGLAGVLIGSLFDIYGLLPLLVWHFTVDAVYTALLLFRSHNLYYVLSAGASSLIFVIPMLISIALYVKRGGFIPDDDLSNATIPVSTPPAAEPVVEVIELPPPIRVTPRAAIVCVIVVLAAIGLASIHVPSPEDVIDYRTPKDQAKLIAAKHVAARTPAHFDHVIATTLEGFRTWNPRGGREDGGGADDRFDSIAASYLLRHGATMKGLVDVFRARVEVATWTVRFFTPSQKEEAFVEIDPRTARAIGYHKYQPEGAPGPRLEQAQALAVARAAFASYQIDSSRFTLKEALSFQQPARRDWLFHFDEQPPIAGDGTRRISVRVAGAGVTQFATTIKVPEAAYREASEQTLGSVVWIVLKIAGFIVLLGMVVGGFVIAAARRRPRWLRALRWTLALAIVPIAAIAASYESSLFGYNTSVQWETFTAGLVVDILRDAALRIGILFLAFAIIDAALPYGLALLTSNARARFGRSAAVAAITAIGSLAALRAVLALLAMKFPGASDVSIDIPSLVAVPWPSLLAIGEAVCDAVVGSAIAVSMAVSFRALRGKMWMRDAIVIAAIFGALLDVGATPAQIPLMLVRSLLYAVTVWAIGRFVLNGNALAWPLAIFVIRAMESAGSLLQHRTDLQINAAVIVVVAILFLLWMCTAPRSIEAPA